MTDSLSPSVPLGEGATSTGLGRVSGVARDGGADPALLEATVTRLRADNEGLRTSLRHRGVIEQAKGILMARSGGTPDEVFDRLVEHSQRTNQKLVRVAAAVVAATVTAREPVAPDDAMDLEALLVGTPAADELARDVDERLGAAALESALDLEDLVRLLVRESAADLAPDAGLVAAFEPDGALRVLASVGYRTEMISGWQRIPPPVDAPIMRAVHQRAPVLLPDHASVAANHPIVAEALRGLEALAAVPLWIDDRVVGSLALSWQQARDFDADEQARLLHLGNRVARTLARLLDDTDGGLSPVALDVADSPWFRAMLDAVLCPAFVLQPLRDENGQIRDFRVDFVNTAALDEVGRTDAQGIVGATVLELYPRTASRQLYPTFLEVLGTGQRRELRSFVAHERLDGTAETATVDVATARLGDRLLVSWRCVDADAPARG